MKHRIAPQVEGASSTKAQNSAVQTIEIAMGLLLPHTVSHVFTPSSTPMRWREKYGEGEVDPHALNLRLRLDNEGTRRIDWDVVLKRSHDEGNALWTCTVTEPVRQSDLSVAKSSTHLKVFENKTEVERKLSRRVPGFADMDPITVGGEWDFALSKERRAELVEYVVDAVAYATVELPARQAEFIERRPDVNFSASSFDATASPVTREVLAPLIIYFCQAEPG